MTALLRPPPWTVDAACVSHHLGPAAWDHSTPAARRVCADCPVRKNCADQALADAIPTGMWGGLSPDDRRRIAAGHHGDLGTYDRPGQPRHGDRARYVDGCRCAPCKESHRRWAAERRAAGAWARRDTTDRRIPA